MPIKVANGLPAREILEKENIFVMDEDRAMHQDIRPIQILILNLMPLKEDTELQILRELSNTPLQIDCTFMRMRSHQSKNTSKSHLDTFYTTFDQIRKKHYDGMIVTGAPVELLEFEQVDYWEEIEQVFSWINTHVTSTIFLCWGAQAAMYYYYGLKKKYLGKKLFGIYEHKVFNRKVPLVRGFDDEFVMPHSRYTEVPARAISACPELTILAQSKEAGVFLCMAENGRKIYVMGHPEYDRMQLRREYERDKKKGLDIQIPANYFPDDDPGNKPLLLWRAHANNLYTNWLNYYVYQSTPYDLDGTPWGEEIPDTYNEKSII
ncbi:MAG: homoserine O-succinyltransferase [Lachnospiraceae bacterium]|jgi:homoserine O-succinyltransferase|nr:homoserine O-succinyltransferase [Lachnospiraceae bacterium]MBR6398587.1 homoserine O-succinyltransferase [Lachnospiraceae bacterium]MBR7015811.1 homoserine O-succinyltransferase [Lachnospiraceae bacterium]MEE3436586.1 homoserine O-succinyltransferase [Lachnospiraceae bacterium]